MIFKRDLISTTAFFLFMFSNLLYAERIYLVTGVEVEGTIIKYNNDTFEIISEKKKIQIKKNEISIIIFDSNKPRAQFSSPQKTFEFWKDSAIKSDIIKISLCYSNKIRIDKLRELEGFSKEQIKDMSKRTKKSKFVIFDPVIVGDRATLRVERTFKGDLIVEFIEFVLENGEWKITE